jgi:hypothetical protein
MQRPSFMATIGLLLLVLLATARLSAQALQPSHKQPESGPSSSDLPPIERCANLAKTDFSNIEDAPTKISQTKLSDAGSDLSFCRVQGYVNPQVRFEIRLPVANWNGKFVETGCAGACGTIMVDWLCPTLLKKGYACLASDMGHEGRIEDGLWAYNNLQAELDFGYRAAHVTALAGKAISKHFYGRAPDRSYFCGCSTGGREGLMEAQRFPWDFDGIIAGAPASDQAGTIMTRLWAALALRASDGRLILSQADLQVVHRAVVAACDMNDGLRDGLIGDPRACHFEIGDLTCRGDAKDQCLSNEQVTALRKIYSGPTTSAGNRIYADGALMFGSEIAFGEYYQSGHFSSFDTDYLKYMAFLPAPGPDWQISDLDFERYYKRFGMTDALYAANNPDLRAFKARGGKLIMYQGWADAGAGGVPPLKAVNYYETTERTMGGPAATRDFFRLFMIPGMGHCGGGEGASNVDYVSYLEEWVEKGRAPDALLATHTGPGESIFTRPVFPYPKQAKYKGVGDPANADNFKPTDP